MDLSTTLIDAWRTNRPEAQDLLIRIIEDPSVQPGTLKGLTSALENDDRRTREIAAFILTMLPVPLGVRNSQSLSELVVKLLKMELAEAANSILQFENEEALKIPIHWTRRRWWFQLLVSLGCYIRTEESLAIVEKAAAFFEGTELGLKIAEDLRRASSDHGRRSDHV